VSNGRALPPSLAVLAELALDLRWTWNHSADAMWRALDAETWERTRNAWFVVQNVAPERLAQLATNDEFLALLDEATAARRSYRAQPQKSGTDLDGATVAYFSMELAIGEALPLYAGGLGVLAGDYLKTASDLGMPVVGVGLLFAEGYFRQVLDDRGRQHEAFPYNDPTQLPIVPLPTRVSLELPGRRLWLRVWRADVGRVPLYLLDSNHPFNAPVDRGITSKLYGGDAELRLQQELVLGIGGWRALAALGIHPEIAHLNEGHAAFALLERIREQRDARPLTFEQALWATRAGNVFTTHTPVAAGFDKFTPALIETYFPADGDYLAGLGLTSAELLALGRVDPRDHDEPFNMAHLALRGATRANGVSALHADVSRGIFAPLFPRWPLAEVPVGYVTNGVHVPSWDSPAADALWTRACGPRRWRDEALPVPDVDDAELWHMRTAARQALVTTTRARLQAQLARRGAADERAAAAHVLDPDVLTLGFARRFATYKRPGLLLADLERLTRLLYDPARPMQIVVAGKAHPADLEGKQLIEAWLAFVRRPEVRQRAVFLEDYDLELAAEMVQGVDVWINTPRRPMEACGTSGMKVLVNGGLNLSSLDGWWAEAYAPDVGWAIGDGSANGDDTRDAAALYELLEHAIAPEFYDRGRDGIPRRWCERIRASMTRLAPRFSSNRMAADYVTELYRPALVDVRARTGEDAARARALDVWERTVRAHWPQLQLRVERLESDGRSLRVEIALFRGELHAENIRVELYAEPREGVAVTAELAPLAAADATGWSRYGLTLATTRPASDFTPRVVPWNRDARIPMELPLIAWPS
jgi:starch phosphorylase